MADENPYIAPSSAATSTTNTPSDSKTDEEKLPPWAYVLCGWPLLLFGIGGAIGGGLGGAAFGINVSTYKSSVPIAAKCVLNILTGLGAAGIWFAIALAINSARA